MPSCFTDADLLPLSWISQWGYCPRRCGLLALEQLWSDNGFTAEGAQQHRRAHTPRTERRGDRLAMYELPVFSRALGLSGLCDCVEANRADTAEDASVLPEIEGRWRLYPVEYKHGVVRQAETEYHMQLCAQALCLEEMYGGQVQAGAIFYIQDHRRDEIELSEALRGRTLAVARAIRDMIESGAIPAARKTAKCRNCSMSDDCMPGLKASAAGYLDALRASLKEAGS